ncbi:MAG: hypothetical protein R3E31_17220 [Chloroflexota bacterium]
MGHWRLALLYAAAGLGAILGPLLANALTDGSTRLLQNAIGISFAVVAAGWLLFGWAPTLPLALFAMLLRHMGGSTNWTYSNVLLQMRVPDRFLGRVFALDFALFTLAMSLSVWLSGILLDQTNLDPRHLSFLPAGVGQPAAPAPLDVAGKRPTTARNDCRGYAAV